ncbi:class I SAM-dependent methyltransferase [Paenibacillus sp. PK3_47]|nr:class I SAM-dependent methyltransferase [Paenibacillus sp. PK3_47]
MHQDSVSLGSYEQMAEYYFSDVDNKPYNAYYERPATLSLLPDAAGKTILDAGCAAGWYTGWLLEQGAAEVTAVDFSPAMIEMTRKRVGERARLVCADLNEPLDFIRDDSTDIVVSSLALHYLKDWNPVLREFYRVLKPDGTLVFSVHHPFMDFTVFKRENYFLTELLDDEWDTATGPVQVQFYRRPLGSIISSLLEAGFTLDAMLEPMPTEDFRKALPESYDKLTRRPQFLFIRARKSAK